MTWTAENPAPTSSTPLPSSEHALFTGDTKPEPCTRVHTTEWGVDLVHPGPAAARGPAVGWRGGCEALKSALEVLRRVAVGGSLGAAPPVLRNLSLENCKFISQKGPRAEMTSKRTNHFLQSSTELGLGGGAVTIRGGAPVRLVHPHVFPQPTPGSGPREMEQRVGLRACMGGHSQKCSLASRAGHLGGSGREKGPCLDSLCQVGPSCTQLSDKQPGIILLLPCAWSHSEMALSLLVGASTEQSI